jgi:UDP-glucose 4-epimerase
MRILVTGSSGMIGTAACEELARAGHEVIGADRRPNAWNSAIERATVRVDLREVAAVRETLPERCDVVVHLAANARVHDLVVDPVLARDNFETTFNVLEYCRRRGVARVVLASSREVYGAADRAQHAEGDARIEQSISPYAACKLGAEALATSYAHCYGLRTAIVRLSNVYGRYDDSDRVIPKFLRAAVAGHDLEIFGAEKVLDFTYLDDCVRGLVAAVERASAGTFNVASGTGSSLVELADLVRALVPSTSRVVIGANRTGEVVRYVADIALAREQLGYAPRVPLAEGLARTLAWYREHGLV